MRLLTRKHLELEFGLLLSGSCKAQRQGAASLPPEATQHGQVALPQVQPGRASLSPKASGPSRPSASGQRCVPGSMCAELRSACMQNGPVRGGECLARIWALLGSPLGAARLQQGLDQSQVCVGPGSSQTPSNAAQQATTPLAACTATWRPASSTDTCWACSSLLWPLLLPTLQP